MLNRKYKKLLLIFILIIVTLKIIPLCINYYNIHSIIKIENKLKNEYSEYDETLSNINIIFERISLYDAQNKTRILKKEYKNNSGYTYYNEFILKINNDLFINNILTINDKKNKIPYKDIDDFNQKESYINERMQNRYQEYINKYDIKIESNTIKSEYDTSTSKLFNINGKKYIYNDYKRIITNELKLVKTLNIILENIEKELNQ